MLPGLIDITPDPIAFRLGPLNIGWYGIGYVVGIAVMLFVTQRELDRRGIDRKHATNALILVAVCALIGARLYHVIDQWAYYSQNLSAIVLPPYSGLGLYGGIAGAIVGIAIYARRHGIPLARALDACVPGTLFAQGIARWGNFFNQELYGPPTDAPWGIAIQCDKRVPEYSCGLLDAQGNQLYPEATTGFHPMFFYESSLDILGGFIALWLSRRHFAQLRDGDLVSFWFIWYGSVRIAFETLRSGYNWAPFLGIPAATLIGVAIIAVGVGSILWRHRRPRSGDLGAPDAASSSS